MITTNESGLGSGDLNVEGDNELNIWMILFFASVGLLICVLIIGLIGCRQLKAKKQSDENIERMTPMIDMNTATDKNGNGESGDVESLNQNASTVAMVSSISPTSTIEADAINIGQMNAKESDDDDENMYDKMYEKSRDNDDKDSEDEQLFGATGQQHETAGNLDIIPSVSTKQGD